MFNKNIFRYKKRNSNLSEYSSTRGLTGCGVCKREKEREEGRKKNHVWEGRKKVPSKRWKSLFVGGRRSAHLAGKWNVARGAILPSTIFPTPSSMLRVRLAVFKWYSAVPPITLPRLYSSLSIKEKKEGERKKTNNT